MEEQLVEEIILVCEKNNVNKIKRKGTNVKIKKE